MKKTFILLVFSFLLVNGNAQTCTPQSACSEAQVFCGNLLDGFTYQTSQTPVIDSPSPVAPDCPLITLENNTWISFIPCEPHVEIEIMTLNCYGPGTNGGGLQAVIYDANDCFDFTPVSNCLPQILPNTNGLLVAGGLTPGHIYHLMIDGYAGDWCDYVINVLAGVETGVPEFGDSFPGSINGPSQVGCGTPSGYVAEFTVNPPGCEILNADELTCPPGAGQSMSECLIYDWTLPAGAVIIDYTPNFSTVTIDFTAATSGLLEVEVLPNPDCSDCACGLCLIEETIMPLFVSVNHPSAVILPNIYRCIGDTFSFCQEDYLINSFNQQFQCLVGCDNLIQNVIANILILSVLNDSIVIEPGESAGLLTIAIPQGNLAYSWSGPGIGTSNQNLFTPVVTEPGMYIVTVTDTLFQCMVTDTVRVFLQGPCTSYNFPAPPGDSCHTAPLFCGENLDGFCSNNGGYTADTSLAAAFGCSLENTHWIRFTPCEEVVTLTITTADCINGDGLEAGVFSSNDCENFIAQQTCINLAADSANTFTVSGLTPGEIYYLVLDGIDGDACDYRIDVVSGISLDPPQWVTVNEGYIDGPSPICVGDLATYFIVPPDCELVSGPGGCPLPPEACPLGNDSMAVIWHIPGVASFVSDSVNVDTIQVIWNGLPTPGDDSIWVEFQYFPDTTNMDSLVFCGCTGTGCNAPINGLTVLGQFFTENLTAHLDCNNPSVDFCGQTISSAGIYVCPIPCGEQILTVTEDFASQMFDLGVVQLCPGECFELMGNQYCAPGSYTEQFTNPANGCTDTYTFMIIFLNEPPLMTGPVTELCDATGQYFTVGFSIVSGTPPYFVDGVQLPGSFYQSPPLPSGQAYGFQVSDAAACNPGVVMIAGTWECPCLTNPGTAGTNLLSHCESEMAAVAFNNDAQLGPDDLLLFVLHTGSGATLGSILGVNTTGVFSFDDGSMNYGQTYYISPVAGPDDGSGMIDFGALCAMAAPGQPVVFYETPTADLLPPATLTCDVTDVTLDVFTMGGSGSFSYEWTGPGGFTSASPNPNVSISGDYDLILTDDLSGCSTTAAVFVGENMEAPDLAATNGELTCAEPETQLEAISTTPGVAFTWTSPSGQVVSGENILANETGSYTVVATAPNGCTAEVQAEVTGTTAASIAAEIEAAPPTCFGDSDGFIKILGTSGGEAPYLLLVNGSPLPPDGLEDLPPGEYLLAIEDANGCMADTLIDLPEPVEVSVSLGEDHFIQLGQSVTLGMQASIVPFSVQWSGSGGQSWQDVTSVLVQPMESGSYAIVISDINACTAMDEVYVFVEGQGKVFIPSAFSPNGDGQNDVLMIYAGPDVLQIRSFLIFDRWGVKVFEDQNFSPNDLAHGWNGTMKGKAMKPAVFVYRAEVEFINGETKVLTGGVTLVL